MRKILSYLFYLPVTALLLTFAACSDDDDDPVPADPTVMLNATSGDAFRGGTINISGTVTAPGGFATLTADGTAISGLTVGETGDQNFTLEVTIPETAQVGSTIEIDLVATDALQQQSPEVSFTINVVSQGAPTIAINGMSTADAKRRVAVTIGLNINAAEGIDELTVTDGDGNAVATVVGADITDPANFSWEYTVPDEAVVGSDIVLNHNVTDNAGITTTTAAVFTITVLDFDAPTVTFTDFESGADLIFNAESSNEISLTATKDALVNWNEIRVVKVVNGDGQDPLSVDISSETGSTITYTLSVDEEFLDEVDLTIFLTDEFDSETDRIDFSYDVLTSTGETFLIDEVDVNGTMVQRVRGNITDDVTFMSANDYWLSGGVEVSDDATLTIEEGTTVYAEPGVGTQLEIDDSGVLIAVGSAASPIVFTSGASLEGNTAEPGDWSGIRMEGGEEINSGTLRYVRVEYGGDGDAGLRLNNLDVATTLEFIQVYRGSNAEPGVELRGGNVHVSNLVITECEGLGLDLDDDDNGYEGSMQYVIISSSTILEKRNGDGDEVRDFEVRDGSSPTMANVTIIGSGNDTPDGDVSAVRIRSSAAGIKLYNFLIAEYSDDGIRQDDVETVTDLDGDFVLAHSFIFQIADQPTRDDFDDPVTGDPRPLAYETDALFVNTIDADNTPTAAAGIDVNDFVPDSEIMSAFDPTTLGGSFSAGPYVGAIGAMDWTLGWTLNADGSVRE